MLVLCHWRAPAGPRALVWQLVRSQTAGPGVWQVSSHGRVSNTFGAISFGSATASGYFRSRMCGEDLQVHRVVAHAFLGPPPSEDAWQVHHKDGSRGNNHISNLEYVTQSQNVGYSYASGTRRCSGPMFSKPVIYWAVGSKDWTQCPSVNLAALELGVSPRAVSKACRLQVPATRCVLDIYGMLNCLERSGSRCFAQCLAKRLWGGW